MRSRGGPHDTRDDILTRLLALNAHRAELERLTGLPSSGSAATRSADDSTSPAASDADANPDAPTTPKPKRAKKATNRASKKSAPRPLLDETDE